MRWAKDGLSLTSHYKGAEWPHANLVYVSALQHITSRADHGLNYLPADSRGKRTPLRHLGIRNLVRTLALGLMHGERL
jgi:hypothetical protein